MKIIETKPKTNNMSRKTYYGHANTQSVNYTTTCNFKKKVVIINALIKLFEWASWA